MAASLLLACSASGASAQVALAEAASLTEPPVAAPGHPREPRGGPARPHTHGDGDGLPADPSGSERDWLGGRPWLEWDHAAGDVGGLRTALDDAGISLHVVYTLDWSTVFSGGVSRRAATDTLLDITVEADLETLVGVSGASVFFNYYSTDGRGQGRAGDFQGWSNIETAENDDQIGELWFQQRLLDDRLRIKIGKVDANTEFAYVESASEFLNSSAGFSPTIAFLPTYPDPATGVLGFVEPCSWLYVGAGLFDGAAGDGVRTGPSGPGTFFGDDRSSDWFVIGEAGVKWRSLPTSERGGPWWQRGRAAIGCWAQTGTLERFDGSSGSGTRGMYLLAEQQVWAAEPASNGEFGEGAPSGSDRGVWMFMQFGRADERISEAGTHVGLGLTLNGTLPGRGSDVAGVYLSWVDLSNEPNAGFDSDETAVEVFYKVQVAPWFSMKPDVQFIRNPGGDSSIDTTVVGAIRFEITF